MPSLLRLTFGEALSKKANFGAVKICLFAQIEHLSKINTAKSREAGEHTKIKRCQGAGGYLSNSAAKNIKKETIAITMPIAACRS